ncbi:MAG TPA: hypothetical protein VIL37_12705 [Natronosporangium sp.]
MEPVVIDIGIAVVSIGMFVAAYTAAMIATRPARPTPAPASPDLGEEPPAVVNLLANRWRLTEDAAEATLLDLAAKRLIELRQPANDPMHTTIHMRPPDELPELTPYERRVLNRIWALSVDGVIPVTALTFRNEKEAKSWTKRLHKEVIADARARGLSRRRFGPQIVSALMAVAALAAVGLTLATLRFELRAEDSDPGAAFVLGFFSFGLLGAVVSGQRGERDTPAGQAAAAKWLGVRDWLRGHEEFADLPPASVTVWDRYLPYGAALGVTHTASAILDLGMGDRTLVWSSYGNRWRRVRVRYPMFWGRYGRSVPSLVTAAVLTMLLGAVLIAFHRLPSELELRYPVSGIMLAVGIFLVVRGAYRGSRALIDLPTTRVITGQVLWIEPWRTRSQGKNKPRVPWLHYLAVDDGRADQTTAWGLPDTLGARCRDSDTVTIQVRPWSRRVISLAVLKPGQSRRVVDTAGPEEETGSLSLTKVVRQLTSQVAGQAGAGPAANTLVTAEEVSRALGLPIREPELIPGLVSTATFKTADRGRDVLLVQLATGAPGRWAWRMNQSGMQLPGIGDGARQSGDHAAMRVGDTTVVLTLMRQAKGRHQHLPWLLQQAAARLGAGVAAANVGAARVPGQAPPPGPPATGSAPAAGASDSVPG